MKNNLKISPDTSIREAISVLIDGKRRTVFIVDACDKLIGIFTDGDMRRFLLKNEDLSMPIKFAMNSSPIVFHSFEEAEDMREQTSMIVFPIVDKNGKLVDALFQNKQLSVTQINSDLSDVPLVIMAGGKGTRLFPYTKIIPKALMPVGDITISERIINSFMRYGCNNVYFVLNHKANMIVSYFNDIEKDYDAEFIKEEKFLGTGGGLSLLKPHIKSTFMLSNCDILIDDDLSCAYKTHKKSGNIITFICSVKDFDIPYGVIKTDKDGLITDMIEKPKYTYMINTGVYVVEPEIFNFLGDDEYIGMPDLAKRCIDNGKKVGVFPISEKSWYDIGQINEYENVCRELS
jgi:dTDP-glucose pyrophosphorylase